MKPRPSRWGSQALGYALLLASVYLALALCYIRYSSSLAARMSRSVDELALLERGKGTAFVVITALAAFGLSYVLLRRLERQAEVLARSRETLMLSERRALAGLLAASIAHDCNNIVGCLLADVHEVGKSQLEGEGRAALGRIRQDVDRLIGLFRTLMTVGRERSGSTHAPLELASQLRELLARLRAQPRLRDCAISARLPPAVPFTGNAQMLEQMVFNLVLNAADATAGHGRVELRLTAEVEQVVLEVHDNGPGVPVPLREQVFAPFFSTRPEGSGLGLLAVRGCAEAHGGTVAVLDSPLGGACFRVTLPCPAIGERAA